MIICNIYAAPSVYFGMSMRIPTGLTGHLLNVWMLSFHYSYWGAMNPNEHFYGIKWSCVICTM